MNEFERSAGWLIDATLATLFASAMGWSALHWTMPALAGVAAVAGFIVALLAMRVASRGAGRYQLPKFAMPAWPEFSAAVDELLLDQPLPAGVVRLRPAARTLPTAGDPEPRTPARPEQRPAVTAQIIELKPDGSAALRQALAGLKQARP